MPAISKIRFSNLVYENGGKRFQDDIFQFDGHNAVILLENGGGKTVYVQAVIQAILPHYSLGERKARETFALENGAAHIAVEWILNERPRRYALTAVTLFMGKDGLNSYKYVYEYSAGDEHAIEAIPFVRQGDDGRKRPAGREEIYDYYQYMSKQYMNAHCFTKLSDYHTYIEENFKIIPSEWRNIVRINGAEGDVEGFFDNCKTTSQLVDRLLIPAVEEVLAGKGTIDFADTFEQQREHFKKHRQLQARIKENQMAEEEVNSYTSVYADLHREQEVLLALKQQTKAVYQLSIEERQKVEIDLKDNTRARQEMEVAWKAWQQRKASYQLAILRQRVEKARDEYIQIKEERDDLQAAHDTSHQRLQNLEIAELKHNIQQCEESTAFFLEQLDNLDTDQEIREIEEKLQENSAFLRYSLAEEEMRLLSEKREIIQQVKGLEGQLLELKVELQNLEKKNGDLRENRGQIKNCIDSAEKDMQMIAQKILDNPVHDNVEQEQKKWYSRVVEVEKALNDTVQTIQSKNKEDEELREKIPQLRQLMEEIRMADVNLNQKIRDIEARQNELLLDLKEWRADMYYVDSLYLKQSSITERLEETVEKLRVQKDDLLFKERQVLRWDDMYRYSDYFTADPLLEKWIKEWQNQFHYLEAGTVYVQNVAHHLDISENEIYRRFPSWALSIICLENEAEKLLGRIEKHTGDLSHPVLVLSSEEARAIIENDGDDKYELNGKKRRVFPAAWRMNLSRDTFSSWQQEIAGIAAGASAERIAGESELNRAERLLAYIRSFFDKYPYEDYQQILAEKNGTEEKLFRQEKEINAAEFRREQLNRDLQQLQKNIKDLTSEQDSLSNRIQQGNTYLQKQKEKNGAEAELIGLEQKISALTANTADIIKQGDSVQEQQNRMLIIQRDMEGTIERLRSDPLYKEVQEVEPVFSLLSRETLEMKRQALVDILQQKQQGREQIENRLQAVYRSKAEYEKNLQRKRGQLLYDIDENLYFPVDGAEEISRLISRTGDLQNKLRPLNALSAKKEKEYDNKQKEYELREGDYHNEYGDPLPFSEPLPVVQQHLQKEQKVLQEQEEYLQGRMNYLQTEQQEIILVIIELEKENGRYDFLLDDISTSDLSGGVKQDFPYRRRDMVKEYITNLAELKNKVDRKREEVEREKSRIDKICQQDVSDVKLRKMIIDGLYYNNNYEDVKAWQLKMSERIHRMIRMIEDDIRELDRELQEFITRLHTYLLTLTRELRIIPKKTRVRIEDGWKEIFSFDIPDWDEKEGKEELRKLVSYMTQELESSRYCNENGEEDYVRIRKDIEKWLQAPQLLNSVMKNKIKVKCRKVNVEGKVSTYFNSWETSNQWSGGEKWSKNMALFLGILNYMAEKRQNINQALPRNRTVIMDNPFGRASSDHVLEPVFFIAEQLGFQIIALTALAEGKFVREYFPVVYSCRLRPTVSPDKYIISSEKDIHYAFFQDNDPESLKRMGEHEQIELFV